MRARFLGRFGALVMLAAAAFAAQVQGGDEPIRIEEAWARATPPGATVAGAYMSITNRSGQSDRLIGAKSDRAGTVEIHETGMAGGVMRMRQVSGGIAIKARETVTLKPGGLHLMLTGLSRPLVKGETLDLVLRFQAAGEIGLHVPVLSVGAMEPGSAGFAREPMTRNASLANSVDFKP